MGTHLANYLGAVGGKQKGGWNHYSLARLGSKVKEGKEIHLAEKRKEPVKVPQTAGGGPVIIFGQKPFFNESVVAGEVVKS